MTLLSRSYLAVVTAAFLAGAIPVASVGCAGGYLEKCVAECPHKNFTLCANGCQKECAAPASRKRGFSGFLGQHFTCDDARALNLGDSWYYAWISNPSQYAKCHVGKGSNRTAAEFVPMVNGIGQTSHLINSQHIMTTWSAANVRFLLGYNEPDTGNGHNHPHMCTPAQAAADWPKVQAVAAQFEPPLTLVGPAISSSGPDAWNEDGTSPWLDDFLNNCTHVVAQCDPSSIKYIAMHDYEGDVSKLQRRLQGAFKHYKRQVWLTEFAILKFGAPPSRDKQDAYMKAVLPILDSSPEVFRYAWYTARNAPNQMNGGSNLLPYNSSSVELTSTGKIYAQREFADLSILV